MVLLGLFHCVHRVVDTLDPMSLLYWQVLVELKDYFYRYVGGLQEIETMSDGGTAWRRKTNDGQ
jgi:hypothetical protein